MPKLSYKEKLKIINMQGVEFVDGEIKNHDSKFRVKCQCGEVFETTLRILKFKREGLKTCTKCTKKRMSSKFRADFNEITEYFTSNGCKLISKREDFKNYRSRITYIARCGHLNTASFASFKCSSKYKLCKECSKKTNSGEKTYNWKGGIYNSESIAFRKTYEFKLWRKEVYKRDNYTCQCCGNKGGNLNAHHLDGYNWCVERRTDIKNGVTLCKKCRDDFHSKYGRGNNTKEQYEEWLKQIK